PANGCETNIGMSDMHCGGCGNVCAASESCQFGFCVNTSCPFGQGDCDGDVMNGCETNLGMDNKNCGSCGTTCGASQQCRFGICLCTRRDLLADPAQITGTRP